MKVQLEASPASQRAFARLGRNTGAAAHEALLLLACVSLVGAVGVARLGDAKSAAIAGQTQGALAPVARASDRAHEYAATPAAQAGLISSAIHAAADAAEWARGKTRPQAPLAEHWVPPALTSVEPRAAGVPSRFVVAPGARAKFGGLVDTLGANLTRGDELADAVVASMKGLSREERNALIEEALKLGRVPDDAPDEVRVALGALLESANQVPEWVDFETLNRGAEVMARSGAAGLVTLVSYSLPLTYTSPAGVKPLVWTKDLLEATPRRLAETMDFVLRTATPDALRPGSEGWKTTLRVRLIHAHVRGALQHMPTWEREAWGTPINQTEMLGTNLAFSSVFMDGMERLGFRYTPAERQAVMDLWRYSGYLIGVDPALLAKTDTEGRRIVSAIGATQAPPDADSKRLIDALMNVSVVPNPPASLRSTNHAMTRYMLGDFYADALGIPKGGPLDLLRVGMPTSAHASDTIRRALPWGDRVTAKSGRAIWERVVRTALGKHPTEFLIPADGTGVRSAATPTNMRRLVRRGE